MPDELVPRPLRGRTFTAGRRVRLGDVSPAGRLRFDAIARYLQDVSSDDTTDADLVEGDSWVVRRTVVEVTKEPMFKEAVELTTWCSGTGSRWAERRVSLVGEAGGAVEAATLWVFVDPESGRPRRLPAEFEHPFGESAAGRKVSARLELAAEPVAVDARRPWPLRFVDYDVLGHVNNAAYWAPIEQELARRRDLRAPLRAVVEYGAGLPIGAAAEIAVVDGDSSLSLWLSATGRVAAAAHVVSL